MKKILLAALLFLSFSCRQKNVEIPGHVLDRDVLVNLQVDLYLVEAAHNMNVLKQDSADTEYKALFETVLKKHGVSKEDFESTLRYYAKDNELLDQVYDSVLVKLTQVENTVTYSKEN